MWHSSELIESIETQYDKLHVKTNDYCDYSVLTNQWHRLRGNEHGRHSSNTRFERLAHTPVTENSIHKQNKKREILAMFRNVAGKDRKQLYGSRRMRPTATLLAHHLLSASRAAILLAHHLLRASRAAILLAHHLVRASRAASLLAHHLLRASRAATLLALHLLSASRAAARVTEVNEQ